MTEPNNETEQSPDGPQSRLDIPWLVNSGLVTLVAVFLRFYWLELKPLHHDEGVNGYFLTRLFREGVYKYDPSNYHGPDLYYIALAFTKIFGLNTLSIRWSVAVFGVLTVVLALFLKRWIGKTGALAAGLFLALSPGMVYISRYFIHEILFVFFSLSMVVAILYFIEKKKAGVFAIGSMTLLLLVCFFPPAVRIPSMVFTEPAWQWGMGLVIFAIEGFLVFLVMRMLVLWDGGRSIYLFLASASLILLFATKETAFITVGTMLIAWVCVRIWQKIARSTPIASRRAMILWTAQISLPLLTAVAMLANYSLVRDSFSSLEAFFVNEKVDQAYVLYLVFALLLLSITGFLAFMSTERTDISPASEEALAQPSFSDFRAAFGSRLDVILAVAGCAFVFIYVGVLFFSSFFTYPQGVVGAFEAYAIWTKTGSQDHTQNGTFAYVRWLMEIEAPVLIVGLAGVLVAWVRGRNRVAFFAGLWGIGLLMAYSIIPYKTPWLAISFTLPLCISAGYAIGKLVGSKEAVIKVLGGLVAAVGIGVLAFQTYDLNFVRYDDDRMPYIYAHTRRGFEDLMKRVKQIADSSPRKRETAVDIVSSDYWPMPWYLNDYPNAIFHGQLKDVSDAEMIIASKNQLPEVERLYYGTHYLYGEYPLRPGVELYLLVRKDLNVVD